MTLFAVKASITGNHVLPQGNSGGGSSSETFYSIQEITVEDTSGVDYILTDKITYTPLEVLNSITLTLNGVQQRQGSGKDYMVNGITGKITWLGSSGTGVALIASKDEIVVSYFHNNVLTP
jgi:hypothetical protein